LNYPFAHVCKIDSAAGGTDVPRLSRQRGALWKWQGQGGCKGKEDQAAELPKERTGDEGRASANLLEKTWAQLGRKTMPR